MVPAKTSGESRAGLGGLSANYSQSQPHLYSRRLYHVFNIKTIKVICKTVSGHFNSPCEIKTAH